MMLFFILWVVPRVLHVAADDSVALVVVVVGTIIIIVFSQRLRVSYFFIIGEIFGIFFSALRPPNPKPTLSSRTTPIFTVRQKKRRKKKKMTTTTTRRKSSSLATMLASLLFLMMTTTTSLLFSRSGGGVLTVVQVRENNCVFGNMIVFNIKLSALFCSSIGFFLRDGGGFSPFSLF
jgi:hypothetical protein